MKIIWLTVAIVIVFSGSTNAFGDNFLFNAGEKLTFEIKWLFISAGEVVFEILPMETMDGIRMHHYSQVNHFVVVTSEYYTNNIFSDIMHISFYCCEQYPL